MRRGHAVALGMVFILAALAPILASSNPDGLEKTAEKFESAQDREVEMLSSPFPDYTVYGIEGTASEVVAMLIGTALVFAVSLGIAKAVARAG